MLPNHAPLVVAEQFGTLAALLSRDASTSGSAARPAPTSSPRAALRREATPSADDFPEQLGELGCFLAGEWPDGHPYARHPRRPARHRSSR